MAKAKITAKQKPSMASSNASPIVEDQSSRSDRRFGSYKWIVLPVLMLAYLVAPAAVAGPGNPYTARLVEEDNFYGKEWATITEDIFRRFVSNPTSNVTVHSVSPLVVTIDDGVTDAWVDQMLAWQNDMRTRRKAEAEKRAKKAGKAAVPWCFATNDGSLPQWIESLNQMGAKSKTERVGTRDLVSADGMSRPYSAGEGTGS
jgi:hypothetical protein